MHIIYRIRVVLFVCCFSLILTACQVARMEVDASLLKPGALEMPVEGRQGFGFKEVFAFGPYKVDDVHRGWVNMTSWGIAGFSSSKARQAYRFAVSHDQEEICRAECATSVKWKDLDLNDFLGTGGTLTMDLHSDTLFMTTFTGSDKQVWKMVMTESADYRMLEGVLSMDGEVVEIKPTRELAGSAFPLTEVVGYHFVLEDKTIGAVQVINDGTIWVSESLAQSMQDALAGASASLLLYRDLKEDG